MAFADGSQKEVHVELPTWLLPQLMRVLPQLDALLREHEAPGLVAYGVAAWQVQTLGGARGLTACFRDERQIESGFHLQLDDARTLHRELGEAIERAADEAPLNSASLN